MSAADGRASRVWQPGMLLRRLVTRRGGGVAVAMVGIGQLTDVRLARRTRSSARAEVAGPRC